MDKLKSPVGIGIIVLVLGIALIGFLVWFFGFRGGPSDPPPAPKPTPDIGAGIELKVKKVIGSTVEYRPNITQAISTTPGVEETLTFHLDRRAQQEAITNFNTRWALTYRLTLQYLTAAPPKSDKHFHFMQVGNVHFFVFFDGGWKTYHRYAGEETAAVIGSAEEMFFPNGDGTASVSVQGGQFNSDGVATLTVQIGTQTSHQVTATFSNRKFDAPPICRFSTAEGVAVFDAIVLSNPTQGGI